MLKKIIQFFKNSMDEYNRMEKIKEQYTHERPAPKTEAPTNRDRKILCISKNDEPLQFEIRGKSDYENLFNYKSPSHCPKCKIGFIKVKDDKVIPIFNVLYEGISEGCHETGI